MEPGNGANKREGVERKGGGGWGGGRGRGGRGGRGGEGEGEREGRRETLGEGRSGEEGERKELSKTEGIEGQNVDRKEGWREAANLRLVNGCRGQVLHNAGCHGDGSYLQFRGAGCDVSQDRSCLRSV